MKRAGRVTARTRSLWTVLIGYFSITGLRPTPSVKGESVDVVKVSAVAGGDATLPCDTFSKTKSDVLLLVVWYKNNAPLYSFDGRVPGPTAHWSDEVLQGRARWHSTNPSSLRIRNILPTDRATYHCRVDFKISPTKNHKVQLEVIELPEKPKIFDETDKELVGVAGPYVEDRTDLRLTCIVSGGKPMPRLRWWRNDKVISTLLPLNDDTLLSVLELKIPILTRDYYEAVYTCTADNTVLVPPARVNIQINMYLRPLFVEILPREQPLTVSQPAEIACRAVGARPPASITWWLDDRQLTPMGAQKDTEDKNGTISYLQWTPTMADNHHRLTCRAAHIKLEDTTIETSIKLNLHYIPIVNLTLGPTLNPNDIEENDDVYFDCTVDSFPPAYKVVWEHEGQVMTHNQRAGIIAGSAHLALQSVKRHQAGKYRCTASNVEGDGTSDPIHLQVIYKPICMLKMKTIVGVALNEPTKVLCEVDGFPTPKSFQWILNNSMGAVEIEANKFTQDDHGRSVLTYTATSERDYGSLTCKASNLAGQQVEGCHYTLLPAVRPDPLANCSSLNLTEDTAEIKCAAGYDGGLQTSYTVEVWELKKLIANVSTAAPSWLLRGLGPGKRLKLVLYAHNARGRSEAIAMKIHTLALALVDGKPEKTAAVDVWLLGIIVGITGTFLVIVIITLLARNKRREPLEYEAPLHPVKNTKGGLESNNHSPVQPDDKNPDVVPLGKDFNIGRDIERPPEPPPYGAVLPAPVAASRSTHSLTHQELRTMTLHTPVTPASDIQSIVGPLADDRRSLNSGTFRRREIVTTRTPLLANTRESCV